jgi:hypothetical protein
MYQTVPEWALKRGVTIHGWHVLERIFRTVPEDMHKDAIFDNMPYEDACCINQARIYGRDKGLL